MNWFSRLSLAYLVVSSVEQHMAITLLVSRDLHSSGITHSLSYVWEKYCSDQISIEFFYEIEILFPCIVELIL